ncbi:MAG: hypothetical protein U0802_23870 [Candidatus Binatia bacterium]
MVDLRRDLARAQIVASDRRYRQALDVLRAHAWLDGRDVVVDDDVFFLEHVLWRDPSRRAEVRAAVHRQLRGYVDDAQALLFQTASCATTRTASGEQRAARRAVVEAHTKIRHILPRSPRSSTTRAPAARSTPSRRCGSRSSRSSTRCSRRCDGRGRGGRGAHALGRGRRLRPRRFAGLSADSPAFQALLASGGKLLPHFDGFVLDLYALCYKMNVVLHAPEADPGRRSSACSSTSCAAPRRVETLRQQTVLDERVAGLGALLLGEALLELLKSGARPDRAEMLDLWNLEQQAAEIAERREHADTAELAAERSGQSGEKQLNELRQRLERENSAAQRTSSSSRAASPRRWAIPPAAASRA